MITPIRLAVAALLTFSSMAGAHPHSYVDQQALLSVGLDVMAVTIRIVPSFEDGAAIFAHIDDDADGAVSDLEAAMFGATVISKAEFEVDGRKVALRSVNTTVPGLDRVAAGSGVIEVAAIASFTLGSGSEHRLVFNIAYEDFSHDWLIQPYFYRDFVGATSSQVVQRSDAGNRVGIDFTANVGL